VICVEKRRKVFCIISMIVLFATFMSMSSVTAGAKRGLKEIKQGVKVEKKLVSKNVQAVNGRYVKKGDKWYCLNKKGKKLTRMFPEEFEKNVLDVIVAPGWTSNSQSFFVLGKDGKLWVNSDCFGNYFCLNYKYQGESHLPDLPISNKEKIEKTYKDITVEHVANKNFEWELVLFEQGVSKIWLDYLGDNIALVKNEKLYTYGMVEVYREDGSTVTPGDDFYFYDTPPPYLVEYSGVEASEVKKVVFDFKHIFILMKYMS